MTLGRMMRELQDETRAEAALLSLGDILLLAELDAAREAFDETRGQYAAGAAARFAQGAGDEEWVRLMGVMERAPMPAAAALTAMLRWSFARDRAEAQAAAGGGCGCGSGHAHDHP